MIQTKAMFGGVGFIPKDCSSPLIEDTYLKVDDSNRPDFEARGMRPFLPP